MRYTVLLLFHLTFKYVFRFFSVSVVLVPSLIRYDLIWFTLFLPHFYVMTKPSHPTVTQWHCSHIALDVGACVSHSISSTNTNANARQAFVYSIKQNLSAYRVNRCEWANAAQKTIQYNTMRVHYLIWKCYVHIAKCTISLGISS